MSFRMRQPSEQIETWGYIIQSIPQHVNGHLVGNKLVIQTPYWIEFGNGVWYPVFISCMDTHPKQELVAWFIYNHRKPSPIYFISKKRGSEIYTNEYADRTNDQLPVYPAWWVRKGKPQPDQIMWIFPWRNFRAKPLIHGIPSEANIIRKILLDHPTDCSI